MWLYRYDCICNVMEPSICLDIRQPYLSAARLTGDPSLVIEAQRISPDDVNYVLISSLAYVSNCRETESLKIRIVQSGSYDNLKWSLPFVTAHDEQDVNGADREAFRNQPSDAKSSLISSSSNVLFKPFLGEQELLGRRTPIAERPNSIDDIFGKLLSAQNSHFSAAESENSLQKGDQ